MIDRFEVVIGGDGASGLDGGIDVVGALTDLDVDDLHRAEFGTGIGFLAGLGQTLSHLLGWVATATQPCLLFGHRWGLEKDQQGVRIQPNDLPSALDIDLEDEIVPVWGLGSRRAVVVVEKLGVLQEPVGGDATLERLS